MLGDRVYSDGMRVLIALALLTACTTDDPIEEMPDAGGIIPIPCATWYPGCDAARDLAVVTCDRRLRCDPLYDAPWDLCVHNVVLDLCAQADCLTPDYERPADLDACIAGYAMGACDDPLECHI